MINLGIRLDQVAMHNPHPTFHRLTLPNLTNP
jgi:hypothetical protein